MRQKLSRRARGTLCTIAGGICGGVSGICSQYLFTHWTVDSLWTACVRLLASGGVLTLLALPGHRREMCRLARQPWELLRLLSVGVGLMLCQSAYLQAISWTNAATATVLQNVSLVLIMLAACVAKRRPPRRREGLSLALAVFGTWMLATGGNPHQLALVPRGLLWGLVAAAAVALYMVVSGNLLARWGRQAVIGPGMLLGGLILLVLSRSWNAGPTLPPQGWAAIAGIVLGTVLSFSLVVQGIADIGPVRASMMTATEPVTAAVLSAALLGARFSLADLTGFACIIATIFMLARPEEPAAKG